MRKRRESLHYIVCKYTAPTLKTITNNIYILYTEKTKLNLIQHRQNYGGSTRQRAMMYTLFPLLPIIS